jgi:hypothetical protein
MCDNIRQNCNGQPLLDSYYFWNKFIDTCKGQIVVSCYCKLSFQSQTIADIGFTIFLSSYLTSSSYTNRSENGGFLNDFYVFTSVNNFIYCDYNVISNRKVL